MNATNICFEAVGEIELLSTVAARAQHLMDAGKMHDFAKLAELSAAGSVSAYALGAVKLQQRNPNLSSGYMFVLEKSVSVTA